MGMIPALAASGCSAAPKLVISASPAEILSMQPAGEPPGTQEKERAPVLAAAIAEEQAGMKDASTWYGMQKRTGVV